MSFLKENPIDFFKKSQSVAGCGLLRVERYYILRSHPVWDAWIEIVVLLLLDLFKSSHPVWDAWIEMY